MPLYVEAADEAGIMQPFLDQGWTEANLRLICNTMGWRNAGHVLSLLHSLIAERGTASLLRDMKAANVLYETQFGNKAGAAMARLAKCELSELVPADAQGGIEVGWILDGSIIALEKYHA